MMQQREVRELGLGLSRRELLGVAGGAAVGISALGLAPTAAEAAMKPQYGGSIKIGLRSDISRLDPHPLYCGFGAQPPTPAWGSDLNEAKNFMETYPLLTIFPGVALSLTVLGFNLFGDGLRDILDPRQVEQ